MNNRLYSNNINSLDKRLVSRVRINREYLINSQISEELNTYKNFGFFHAFNDIYVPKYENTKDKAGHEKWQEKLSGNKTGGVAVRSIFNRSGALMVGASPHDVSDLSNIDIQNASEWRISNNVPLLDSPQNRKRIRSNSGCTVKELVEASQSGILGREIYAYSDFMFCKYLGKIPNNYMITLRRFAIPPGDFIGSVGEGKTRLNSGPGANHGPQPIGCMVTWMGTPGNDINNILKYSYKMPFKEMQAKWESIQGGDADANTKLFNSIAAATDPAYIKQFQLGQGGAALNSYVGKMFGMNSNDNNGPYSASELANWRDENKIYGPIDRVKSVKTRGENGLEFKQSITLVFDYELRAYNGINTRQAMLDLISNILAVTYSTGDFWGGGYRGGAMHQNSIFNDLKIFKTTGGFTDFVDAFNEDINTVGNKVKSQFNIDFSNPSSIVQTLKSLANSIGGMIIGGMLNKFGRPAKAFANSLLTDRPVGLWHLTIGNPMHPIISIGNMIIDNCTIEHNGVLGLDDFPTGLKVTIELSPGKPRDIREIERMYMHGNDRIYSSMGPKVMDAYKNSVQYKGNNNKITPETTTEEGEIKTGKKNSSSQEVQSESISGMPKESTTADGETAIGDKEQKYGVKQTEPKQAISDDSGETDIIQSNINEGDLQSINSKLMKWFGETDAYSILFQACEQEYGASGSKEKK